MSPKELRAFRESLGLTRHEFAPKLFISDPTLERWERGQGGPREVHLQILRRMREHLSAGHSIAYFHYDAGIEQRAKEVRHETKEMIVETLRGLGALVIAEGESDDNQDWSVTFGLGWAVGSPIDVTLRCDGSERSERPCIDFAFEVTARCDDVPGLSAQVNRIGFNHCLWAGAESRDDGRAVITMRGRLFKPVCNAEAVTHLAGNFRSCWERLKASFSLPGADVVLPQAETHPTDSGVLQAVFQGLRQEG
jgi:transcriptional regulator with XRE-family HTH domain